MKYMGSKARYAKEFLPIILKDRKPDQWYIEPFCGGCNVIDKVDGPRIASDNNLYLIEMWRGLQLCRQFPTEISRKLYNSAREEYNKRSAGDIQTIGWVGWMASYNGRFFDGGYSGGYDKRDYIGEQIKNTLTQLPALLNVGFTCCDYHDCHIFDNSIIYCDPPYAGAKGYSTSISFDYDRFWEWCRQKAREGHQIFISEYDAPDDFPVVWQKEVKRTMHNTKTLVGVEKLFTYKAER